MTYLKEYYDNTELPYYLKNKKLIKFEGLKNNGIADGPCIIGYISEYNIYFYEKVNFMNGKKNGPYTIHYEDGKIFKEGIYENDLKIGSYKMYYENGNIYEEGIYIDNKKKLK